MTKLYAPLIALSTFFITSISLGQVNERPAFLEQERILQNHTPPRSRSTINKNQRTQDWRTLIDESWGPGESTAIKLDAFDGFWDLIDKEFAAFQGIDVDWDALRSKYRTEIADSVSLGRFAAIMNHLSLALRESHTRAQTPLVNLQTALGRDIPLQYVGGWSNHAHFGACLTPQADSSLLVYKVNPNHPLQLEPGDRILGYDGGQWKTQYRALLAEELPLVGTWWGSSPSSYDHSFLASAGMNWHLFDTIDVIQYATGDTLHYSTASLENMERQVITCNDQLAMPGIRQPDVFEDEVVTWGVVQNTRIGYIYVYGWFSDAQEKFEEAVLALMTEEQVEGLILDFRLNFGGNMFLSNPALSHLFDSDVRTIGFARRNGTGDRLGMVQNFGSPPELYVIPGQSSENVFDHPIAVLMGPGALSSGDQVALRMTFHPRARTFGKSTATAFNSPLSATFGEMSNELMVLYAASDAYLLTDPENYLTHDEFFPDEHVWLEPADVAQGKDTVVEAALDWILGRQSTGVEDVTQQDELQLFPAYPNPWRDQGTISFEIPKAASVQLVIYDVLGRHVATLEDRFLEAGYHSVEIDRARLRPGIYFYKLMSQGESRVRQFVAL